MPLPELSDELLDTICHYAEEDSLRAMRLSCITICRIATKHLYRHVKLWPTNASAERYLCILEDSRLNPLVRSISISTCIHPITKDHMDVRDEETAISESLKCMLHNIGQFQNLRHANLKFASECAGSGGARAHWQHGAKHVKETVKFRTEVLNMLLESLYDRQHPATKVCGLSIENLQDLVTTNVNLSKAFQAVMSGLNSLSLQIATGCDHRYGPRTIDIEAEEAHRFFGTELKQYWLQPVQQHITHLKLYADIYWGYFPLCDLRDLNFPNLNGLALGNMTFTHDWQLDWITSHASTLQTLTLDDCPIVHACRMYATRGPDREPPKREEYNKEFGESVWFYEARWHDYFHRIQSELPMLKYFGCGHGPWKQYKQLEEAFSLPAVVFRTRYIIFDAGTGPSPWTEAIDERRPMRNGKATEGSRAYYSCCWIGQPQYPDCEDEDWTALCSLLAVISRRLSS